LGSLAANQFLDLEKIRILNGCENKKKKGTTYFGTLAPGFLLVFDGAISNGTLPGGIFMLLWHGGGGGGGWSVCCWCAKESGVALKKNQ
jgi:hypothetical protein